MHHSALSDHHHLVQVQKGCKGRIMEVNKTKRDPTRPLLVKALSVCAGKIVVSMRKVNSPTYLPQVRD